MSEQAQLDLGVGEVAPPAVLMVDRLFHLPSQDPVAYEVGTRNGHLWCHLWCAPGSEAALHAFAERIGMRREWFQEKADFPHYDLTPRKRKLAVAAGARETELAEWLRASNTELSGGGPLGNKQQPKAAPRRPLK